MTEEELAEIDQVVKLGRYIEASEYVPVLVAEVRTLRAVLAQIADTGRWSRHHGADAAASMATMAKVTLEGKTDDPT